MSNFVASKGTFTQPGTMCLWPLLHSRTQARKTVRDLSLALINRWRTTHPAIITAVASGAAAAAPAAPSSAPQAAAAAADGGAEGKEQPLVESISGIGQDRLASTAGANGSAGAGAAAAVDAKVLLRRAQGKGVNPGSFLGLLLATKDRSSGKFLSDDVVSRTTQ